MSDNDDDGAGGDPVCWLDRVCPECGAMPTAEQPGRCWRCGGAADEPGPDTT